MKVSGCFLGIYRDIGVKVEVTVNNNRHGIITKGNFSQKSFTKYFCQFSGEVQGDQHDRTSYHLLDNLIEAG